jgi:MOSC domain-containing protein YiiM
MRATQAHGTVEEILVAAVKGGPMDSVPQVVAHPRRGLQGHHRSNLTLIESERIERFAEQYEVLFSSHDARRNIVTRGIDLNALVGREFEIGEVRAVADELCEPCATLARRTHRQVLHGLVHRGGLRCRILSGGLIRVGDAVQLPPA